MLERNTIEELKLIRKKIMYHSQNPNAALIIRDLVTRVLRILRNCRLKLNTSSFSGDIDLFLSSFRYDLFNLDQVRLRQIDNSNLVFRQYNETVSSVNKNMNVLLAKESPITQLSLVAVRY